MQYAVSLEIQIMINAIHADVLCIKNALLKLPAKRVLESGYFGIKAALLILKPALLILKCSLTPDTAKLSNNNSKKPRLHASCYRENRVSNDPIIVFI
jgi:hypothetical protein